MPLSPTYPGVYVEEIPSAVRTITGVPTSITAFIGRAQRGPVDEAVRIGDWGEFERRFGGLWRRSTMSYAVYQYYQNGGSEAVIVRLYRTEQGGAVPARARITVGNFQLDAADPGSWGRWLRATVDTTVSADAAAALGVAEDQLFNLTVRDTSPGGMTEVFRNLTVIDSPRRVDRVLQASSRLVRLNSSLTDANGQPVAITPGDDEATKAIKQAEDDLKTAEDDLKTAQAALAAEEANPQADPQVVQQLRDDVTAAEQARNASRTALDQARDSVTASDGEALTSAEFSPPNGRENKTGMYALLRTDIFNLLCIPPFAGSDQVAATITDALNLCVERRAMFLIDAPPEWDSVEDAVTGAANPPGGGVNGKNAAIFFPRICLPDPLSENRVTDFPPSGAVAGVFARTDAQRGVWKAPAGTDATLNGVRELSIRLTDQENGRLNPLAINCLRSFPVLGQMVWGSRTLRGADVLADQWKYIPVRRLALYIEESLYRGTHWVVFEPNDEPLWASIRLNVGAFMNVLFRQGAFFGRSPDEAYLVKCDRENNPDEDIDRGIVNILVGFRPLKPAEFVYIQIQQLAGQVEA